jgi:hypothetical protein
VMSHVLKKQKPMTAGGRRTEEGAGEEVER